MVIFIPFYLYFFYRHYRLLEEVRNMLESKFQSRLIKDVKRLFPGCIVTKSDCNYIQGIPDLLILYGSKWATLECKQSLRAKKQPNQSYYVDRMNEMSFSRFICPENKEQVLEELSLYFAN